MKIVELVPNFSEGRDVNKIEQIKSAMAFSKDIKILNVESDPNHNRCVITLVSPQELAVEACFRGIKKAKELINLNNHHGEHPRFGAADVIPFIPLGESTTEECIVLARELGKRVGAELNIPVYMYEKAAFKEERRNLADIRNKNFQFEQLKESIKEDKWKPDYGPSEVGTAGASIIGARDFLVAFNVNLASTDLKVAKKIAKCVREKDGGLKNVKALGFELKDRGMVQVSMNLVNVKETPIYRVYELVKLEAERYGVSVKSCEIVGLVPLEALAEVSEFYLKLENFSIEQVLEKKLWSE
jgi:glutamate formiminotransferase